MTYQESEFAALIDGVRSARSLAHKSRIMAQIFPKYEREQMADAARHFARARDYLQLAKAKRAQ